jgi:hypothetical protein
LQKPTMKLQLVSVKNQYCKDQQLEHFLNR